ncbi:hypothetical protein G9409_00475 [Chlorobium sp. BLA1]|uniref:hypothetical protein n=1 Tax=Candidatus Chlorobium masyuteum TaxID=2716876 RepID=UPI001420848C|nr:hypothetical protein [Candidatus Chlorobium masyuteum]NHQ59073.1 hypothetical protein [Candidatus Chlorobium masyuteum]NTU44322.1 hypothetical protein [Chlorobiaceae bacterium]
MNELESVKLYCGLMEDVKSRVALIRRFTSGEVQVGSEQFAYECVSVQLRKVLELIAFASLCANKEKYSEAYSGFAKHWRAKALLDAIGHLHPGFYPQPMRPPVASPDGTKHLDRVADGFLTQPEFVVLYDKCSEVIHTRNPFSTSEPRIDFVHSVDNWLYKITSLLNLHLMVLAGRSQVWLVSMHEPSDGRVHAYIANPNAG